MESVNRKVSIAAFGQGSQVGVYYDVIDRVDGAGVYRGVNALGVPFELRVFLASQPIEKDENGVEIGAIAHTIHGEIRGPSGNVGVQGIVVGKTLPNGEFRQLLLVDNLLTQEQTQTWRATGIMLLLERGTDRLTVNELALLRTNPQFSNGRPAIPFNCLQPDLVTALKCTAAAAAAAAACNLAAQAATAAALAKCAGLLAIPFWGVAAAAICAAAVIALRVSITRACAAALAAATAACLSEYAEDIFNCIGENAIGW